MIANLIQQTENQEKELSSFNLELCKTIKKSTEDNYAPFTLKKDIIPVTRWYLTDSEGKEINLDYGDGVDYIDFEQCFDLKNNYLGTIRSIVVELGPKYIKLATPEKYFYLMGENNKIFGIYKPLVNNIEDNSISAQKIIAIVILAFILILIICGFMIL